MERGEVWWARLAAPVGRRPVLLISRHRSYLVRTSVMVAVITTTIRDIQSEVRRREADGMPRDCVVSLDDILTIRTALLEQRITRLSLAKMRAVSEAIHFSLALEN